MTDSDVMFCLQSYQGLRIDRINTQVIYQFALAQVECKVNVLLNNCKQNTTLLSLLAGRTVVKGGPFIYLSQPSAQDGENHKDS